MAGISSSGGQRAPLKTKVSPDLSWSLALYVYIHEVWALVSPSPDHHHRHITA